MTTGTIHIENAEPRFVFEPVSRVRYKAVPEIIKGYIPMGLKGLFYGNEKTFKTPVAVKTGVDVAMQSVLHHGDPNIPGLGYEVLRHGAVRYIAAELPTGVHTRAREYIMARDPSTNPKDVDFQVLDGKPNLTEGTEVEDLIRALDASLSHQAIMRLVFIDTTVFCLGSADENHPSTVTRAYNAADKIIDHYEKNCSVIFILHTGKDQSRGVRGSSNWEKSAGFRLEFSAKGKVEDVEDGRAISYPEFAVVTSEKNKDGPFQQRVQYQVHRKTFDAFEIDNDNDLPQTVTDSVLHLTIVPYTAKARKHKATEEILSPLAAMKKKIMLLVDAGELGKLYNTGELAALADKFELLKGNPKTRVSNFKKRIYRFMRDHESEIDPDYFEIETNLKGNIYRFVGHGGELGLSDHLFPK